MESQKPLAKRVSNFWFNAGIASIIIGSIVAIFALIWFVNKHQTTDISRAYPSTFDENGEAPYVLQIDTIQLGCNGECGKIKTVDGHKLEIKFKNQGEQLFNRLMNVGRGRAINCIVNDKGRLVKCPKD